MGLPPRLLAISAGQELEETRRRVGGAVEAGLQGVLLREPGWNDRELLRCGELLREAHEELWIGVHDRAHLLAAGLFDGVHLGFRSLPPARVREFAPEECAIGFSAHAADAPADREGATYLFFGPVKDTPSKRGLLEPTGFGGLAEAAGSCDVPVWALGGMTPEDAGACRESGAAGMACLGGLLGSENVEAAVARYRSALEEAFA